MNPKRTHHVMLRLTPAEYQALTAAVPPGEEVAAFARRTLLGALRGGSDPRTAAAFVVAALSTDIGFEEALRLFDDHVGPTSTPEGG